MKDNQIHLVGLSLYPKKLIPSTPYTIQPICVDDGILDYIRAVTADRFPQTRNTLGVELPDYTDVFCRIYNNGWIDESGKDDFMKDELIQNMINLRDLDGEKLWMLCLWVKNYVETTYVMSYQQSPLKEMIAFADGISENINQGNPIKLSAITTNRKRIAETGNTETAGLIRDAIHQYVETIMDGEDWIEDSGLDTAERPVKQYLDAKYQYYIYDTIVEEFLKTRKRKTGSRSIPNDLKYITGHTIFHVGMIYEENLLDDPAYLKNQLSGLKKDIESMVLVNQVYQQKDRIVGSKIVSLRNKP